MLRNFDRKYSPFLGFFWYDFFKKVKKDSAPQTTQNELQPSSHRIRKRRLDSEIKFSVLFYQLLTDFILLKGKSCR